jgi:hypothetical protein
MMRPIRTLLVAILVVGTSTVLGLKAQSSPSAADAAGGATQASAAEAPAAQASPAASQGHFDPNKQSLVLPSGSVLHIRLTTTLTSETNKTGDRFTGLVTQPVVSGDKTLVPQGSIVDGHVAFVKPSGRIRGRAQMRIVLDHINTPDDVNYNLSASLQDLASSTCTKGVGDDEGTVEGCGKSKKKAAEAMAIAGGMGAGAGASVGVAEDQICTYWGCPGQNPNIAADAGYGAAIGAGTALIYSLFKHEKQIVLVDGTDLTFVVNRSVDAASSGGNQANPSKT